MRAQIEVYGWHVSADYFIRGENYIVGYEGGLKIYEALEISDFTGIKLLDGTQWRDVEETKEEKMEKEIVALHLLIKQMQEDIEQLQNRSEVN